MAWSSAVSRKQMRLWPTASSAKPSPRACTRCIPASHRHAEGHLDSTAVVLVTDPALPDASGGAYAFVHWLLPRRVLGPALQAAVERARDRRTTPRDLRRMLRWALDHRRADVNASWGQPEECG